MKRWTHEGADRLRKGRISLPGATYFLTLCTHHRRHGLHQPAVAGPLLNAWRDLHREKVFLFLCGTLMPDHLHLLFVLGKRLPLSRLVGRLKTATRAALEEAGLQWQDNFYDHRLRKDDASEPFARYIFLNPYRAGLIPASASWPWWVYNRTRPPAFLSALGPEGGPPPAWLVKPSTLKEILEDDL